MFALNSVSFLSPNEPFQQQLRSPVRLVHFDTKTNEKNEEVVCCAGPIEEWAPGLKGLRPGQVLNSPGLEKG